MDILLVIVAAILGLVASLVALAVTVLFLGALVEVCTAGAVNFGITTRPWRRSRR